MSPRRTAAGSPPALPDLSVESTLVNGSGLVAGMDEVGRGALAGPVTVGVAVIRIPDDGPQPPVRDSKALSATRRITMVSQIHEWTAAGAVGHASASEIDRHGLSSALGLAGRRAWHSAVTQLDGQIPALLLDGRDNWLSRTPPELCAGLSPVPEAVHLQVKADALCASVAAASILAKVERDAIMVELDHDFPSYGWAGNKGYGSVLHRTALVEQGISEQHRRSWRLLPEPAAEQPSLFGEPSIAATTDSEGHKGAQWTA